jgi:hypothetical protein
MRHKAGTEGVKQRGAGVEWQRGRRRLLPKGERKAMSLFTVLSRTFAPPSFVTTCRAAAVHALAGPRRLGWVGLGPATER